MSARIPFTLTLLLALLSVPPAMAQPAPEEWDTSGARHLELTAENAGEAYPVRISPHHSTTLVFDTPLRPGGVEVEDARLLKVAVNEAEGLVMLMPSGELPPDKTLRMTVRFADGAIPEYVTFRLVVHPTRAEHQVQVYRRPRSAESYRQGEKQERERAEQCEAVLEAKRTHTEGQPPGGFTGLFADRLLGKGNGITGRRLARGRDFTQRPGETLKVPEVYSYRAEMAGQVAVELLVDNPSPLPWTAEGVEGTTLVSVEGVRLRVVRLWQPEPFVPGASRRLVVVAEATVEQTRGTFLLKLGEANGPRTLTLRGLTFP
jgi:uncharacterized protein (TIGR02268 family)